MRLVSSIPLLVACSLPPAPAQAPSEAAEEIASAPTTSACVHLPVGPPDGSGYRVAQGFRENRHLGEDWNGVGGGNSDKGDPVFAMATGKITFAGEGGPGWGPVVMVAHHFMVDGEPHGFESLYAHLDRIDVSEGIFVERGRQLGTIGDAHGRYIAHLHLEVRSRIGMPIGGGYSSNDAGYVDPREWVAQHQSGCPDGAAAR